MSITTIVISLVATIITWKLVTLWLGIALEVAEDNLKEVSEDMSKVSRLDRMLLKYSGWKNEQARMSYEGIEVVARPFYTKADALEDFVTAIVSIGIVLAVALAIDSPKVGVGEAKIYPVQEIHDAAESQGVRTPEDGR